VPSGLDWWGAYEGQVFSASSLEQLDIMQSWYDAKNEADHEAADAAALGTGADSGVDDGEMPTAGQSDGEANGWDGGSGDEAGGGADGEPVNFWGAMDKAIEGAHAAHASLGGRGDAAVGQFIATGALGLMQHAL